MNNEIIILVSLIAVLIATNVYWYYRIRNVRAGVENSAYWDRTVEAGDEKVDNSIYEIAEILNCSIDEAPNRVSSLDSKVRQLQKKLQNNRDDWAMIVADALSGNTSSVNEKPLIIHLEKGGTADAKALSEAMHNDFITLVYSYNDSTFFVKTNSNTCYSAVDIAQSAMVGIEGGAGGSDTFAQGGGKQNGVFEALEATCEEQTGKKPHVIFLGTMSGL